MTLFTKFCVLAVLVTLAQGFSLNDQKYGNGKKGARRIPIMTLDDSVDSEDDAGLFYASDANIDLEEKDTDQSVLDTLLLDIMQNANGTDNCEQYKSQISEICLTKFIQRTRFRPEEVVDSRANSIINKQNDATANQKQQRITSKLASPQQL